MVAWPSDAKRTFGLGSPSQQSRTITLPMSIRRVMTPLIRHPSNSARDGATNSGRVRTEMRIAHHIQVGRF
jgi:hypothetical protein